MDGEDDEVTRLKALLAAAQAEKERLQAKLEAEQADTFHPGDEQSAKGEAIAQAKNGSTAIVKITHIHMESRLDEQAEEALRHWYRRMASVCSRLPMEVINDPTVTEKEGVDKLSLDDVYVGLDVFHLPPHEAGQEQEDMPQERAERKAVLDLIGEETRIVLIGDPGSGKTTFVNHLAGILARVAAQDAQAPDELPAALQGPLPVRLILRETAARHIPPDTQGNAALLWQAVQSDIAETGCSAEIAQHACARLQKHLGDKGGVFFFDGLDEVPESDGRRKALLEAVRDFAAIYKNSRFMLTARPYAYIKPVVHLPDFSQAHLAPLSEEQRARFIQRWYEAVRRYSEMNPHTAKDKTDSLQSAVTRPNLAEMAGRPLLLTLMATLHTNRGELPDDRAKLYGESVDLLLQKWHEKRRVRGPDGKIISEPGMALMMEAGLTELREAVQRLALSVHERQRGEEQRNGEAADIRREEIWDAFADLLESSGVGPKTLLAYLNHHTGLLIAKDDNGPYAFPHRSFQEYLAACRICDDPDYTDVFCQRVEEDLAWWREVWLLGVGRKCSAGKGAVVHMVNALLPDWRNVDKPQADDWRKAALAGKALLEQKPNKDLLKKRSYQDARNNVCCWLKRCLEEGCLEAKERAEAGDILGRVGDPRPGVGLDENGLPEIDWVDIEGGKFMMGSETGRDNEKPRHPVTLPAFQIGRYPVTVAQYQAFVDNSGHQPPPDWDEQRRYPTRPVVRVSWLDACAFGEWLGKQCDENITLPTEAQWERAARGTEERPYPWGEPKPDNEKANYQGHIGHPTAVGLYPAGATPEPERVFDLAGNVWEWTASLYTDGYQGQETGQAAKDDNGGRVLRGGSWGNGIGIRLRAPFRNDYYPSQRNLIIGFRLARTV